jgi:hypothetical protein
MIHVLLFGGFWHTLGNTLLTTVGSARGVAASLPVHVSQKSKVYLRPAPPLTVVAPCWRFRSARRCSLNPGAPPPCLLSPDCSRARRRGAVSRNAETTVPSSGRDWCRGSLGSTVARRRRTAAPPGLALPRSRHRKGRTSRHP